MNFVVIEAPIVKSVKAARAILQPEPSPDPSFRGGEEEEPPVLEAAGDSDGAFTADGPPVLEAPLAIAAPRGAPGSTPPRAEATPAQIGAGSAGPSSVLGSRVGTGAAPVPQNGAAPPPAIRAAPTGTPVARSGYRPYLREATLAEVAFVALAGLVGLLVMTFSGGVIGYRQANAGRYLLTEGYARFLP